ncbi:hypothetical protein PAAG_11946 [Paracoccidioides lutzii Pb01]|uniref:Uncharacterized protein n=1 Tax=Paracoccidioides lutzii (strain ATCC MYA-826 / Pb01) TaxID=502779 RepID=A0A0A2V1I5_PARBA|nr:hypothetical protein PAAG_11946 [Paracoccidioides lutzii Pb01]KGQ01368.1 hypothetical protein PAAG_11946 [Paracoccidioides lutzii Pb01]
MTLRFRQHGCIFMAVGSHSHLSACVAKNFRVYPDWQLKNFNFTKLNTILVEWKFLRLLYKRVAGPKMDEVLGEQVSESPSDQIGCMAVDG